jgi:hypothetical protein
MITAWLFSDNWDGKGCEWSAYPRSKTRGALLRTHQPTVGSGPMHRIVLYYSSYRVVPHGHASKAWTFRSCPVSPTLSYVGCLLALLAHQSKSVGPASPRYNCPQTHAEKVLSWAIPPGPVVIRKMMSLCSIWQGVWAAAQERRYTKERTRVPSLNTGSLGCTRRTKQGEKCV